MPLIYRRWMYSKIPLIWRLRNPDNPALENSGPTPYVFLFYQKKASSIKQAYLRDTSNGLQECLYINHLW